MTSASGAVAARPGPCARSVRPQTGRPCRPRRVASGHWSPKRVEPGHENHEVVVEVGREEDGGDGQGTRASAGVQADPAAADGGVAEDDQPGGGGVEGGVERGNSTRNFMRAAPARTARSTYGGAGPFVLLEVRLGVVVVLESGCRPREEPRTWPRRSTSASRVACSFAGLASWLWPDAESQQPVRRPPPCRSGKASWPGSAWRVGVLQFVGVIALGIDGEGDEPTSFSCRKSFWRRASVPVTCGQGGRAASEDERGDPHLAEQVGIRDGAAAALGQGEVADGARGRPSRGGRQRTQTESVGREREMIGDAKSARKANPKNQTRDRRVHSCSAFHVLATSSRAFRFGDLASLAASVVEMVSGCWPRQHDVGHQNDHHHRRRG